MCRGTTFQVGRLKTTELAAGYYGTRENNKLGGNFSLNFRRADWTFCPLELKRSTKIVLTVYLATQ